MPTTVDILDLDDEFRTESQRSSSTKPLDDVFMILGDRRGVDIGDVNAPIPLPNVTSNVLKKVSTPLRLRLSSIPTSGPYITNILSSSPP